MRRPLFLVCIALLISLMFLEKAGVPVQDTSAFADEELLIKASEQKKVLTLNGCVTSCDTVSEGKRLSISQISVLDENQISFSLLPTSKLNFTIEESEIKPGDFLVVSGEYVPYQEARNPGNFDAKTYYQSQNVIGKLQNPKIRSVTEGRISLQRLLFAVRETLRSSCEQILDEKHGRTLSAICLGEKSNMEQEWKDMYQAGGISHILAVSGLHVTMIGMTVFQLLRRLRASYAGSAVLSGIFAYCYVLMTGSGVSAVRALLMFFLWLGAQICGRKYDMQTSMAIAAFLIVRAEPKCIQTASFWLSFGAVAVIAILLPCIAHTCQLKNRVLSSIVGSASIFIGTLPITLYFFYQAAPWSIAANLFVTSLMPYLMGMGLLSAAAGIAVKSAGIFLASSVACMLTCFEGICAIEQRLPYAAWIPGKPSAVAIGVYYLLLILTGQTAKKWSRRKEEKKRGRIRILWLGISVLCIGLMTRKTDSMLSVVCLDVGQGDCALVQLPDGTDCLIDGGSSSQKKVWEYRISDTLKYYGADRLEYVFLSHADSDHTNGLLELLNSYTDGITIQNLVLPYTDDPADFEEIECLAKEKNIAVLRMEQGDFLQTQEWSISCLSPDSQQLLGDKNQDSMVLLLQYQSFRMLFTGDLEGKAEQQLQTPDIDVLKVGHHGSKNASSESFLAAASPQAAVISCSEENTYGHPAKETLERLSQAGVRVYETKTGGAIQIKSDGKRFWVRKTVK